MALGIPLPDQIRRSRLITVGADLAVSLDETFGAYFAALVQPPEEATGEVEGPPRARTVSMIHFDSSPSTLDVASRVQLQGSGEVYELTSRVRTVRLAETVMGYEAEAFKLTELYPRLATLRESDDTQVQLGLRCSIFTPNEQVSDRGDYENFRGEAPIEYLAPLQVKNRKLVLGSRTFRVVSAVPNYELPHVALELRTGG